MQFYSYPFYKELIKNDEFLNKTNSPHADIWS